MLATQQALDIFARSGALLEGHFRLTSGRHSNRYMQCAQVLKFPAETEKLAGHLTELFAGEKIDLVIGPAMGGIIIAYEVAKQLGVPALFTEREEGMMQLRRGFEIKADTRVLVVEDVVTTGGSVKEVMETVYGRGAVVVGVGVLVDRSSGQVDFKVPFKSVITLEIESWEPENCPLCVAGEVPLTKPGSRLIR